MTLVKYKAKFGKNLHHPNTYSSFSPKSSASLDFNELGHGWAQAQRGSSVASRLQTQKPWKHRHSYRKYTLRVQTTIANLYAEHNVSGEGEGFVNLTCAPHLLSPRLRSGCLSVPLTVRGECSDKNLGEPNSIVDSILQEPVMTTVWMRY